MDSIRLGKFTGNIYKNDEIKSMEECGVVISEEQASSEEWIKKHHARDLVDCCECFGCPASKK